MELLLGSGVTYDFLASKINSEYPKELIQVGPKYAGPAFNGSEEYWYPLQDEVDEAKLTLNGLEALKSMVFKHVYLCIPNISGLEFTITSGHITKILDEYLVRYCYLIQNLITYSVKCYVFNEVRSHPEHFELQAFCSVVRPIVLTALEGTKSGLILYSNSILETTKLETMWISELDWRKK